MIVNCRQLTVLLYLSLLCAMARNAPIVYPVEPPMLSIKTQQFYCTSDLLKNLVKPMVKEGHFVALPNKHRDETYSQENVNLMLQQFDFTCRTFTNVMAIKNQLQFSLFNGSYYTENNGTLIKIDNKAMKNFTVILEYLQMLETFLQDIENILTDKCKRCMEFSPTQYEKIYWNLVDDDDISVLHTLKNMKWAKIGEYPDEWSKPPNYLPIHSFCDKTS